MKLSERLRAIAGRTSDTDDHIDIHLAADILEKSCECVIEMASFRFLGEQCPHCMKKIASVNSL